MASSFGASSSSSFAKIRSAIEVANRAADIKAAADKVSKKKEDVEDQERAFSFSKRGLDAKTDSQSRLQKERSQQGIESQKTGIEGQSRLQKERTEQTSKLQSQAAAEAAARKAGDRAAAIANFRSRGGSKIGK